MLLQRTCDDENQVKNKLSNGPRRVQSNVLKQSILQREAYVSCRGYDGIPLSARSFPWIQGGTADKLFDYSSLTDISVRDFCIRKPRDSREVQKSLSDEQKPPEVLNWEWPASHKESTQEDIKMPEQNNATNSLAHTKWNCKYHIVFAPKYRRKVFYEEKRSAIREIIRTLCQWKGVEIIEGEVCPDHIHLLLSIPPKMSVSGFMGYLKGKSSLMI